MGESKLPRCFVLMPISDPDGYEKGHFKDVYEQIFSPAIIAAGYEPYRADENKASNMIQLHIIQELLDAPMALCDLSSRNPNVLYELGIRQAFDKPVVLVQQTETERIFDISSINTINYHAAMTYKDVVSDQTEIANAIRATAGDRKGLNSLVNLIKINTAKMPVHDISDADRMEVLLSGISNDIKRLENQIEKIVLSPTYVENVEVVEKETAFGGPTRLFNTIFDDYTKMLATIRMSYETVGAASRHERLNRQFMEIKRRYFRMRKYLDSEQAKTLDKLNKLCEDELALSLLKK